MSVHYRELPRRVVPLEMQPVDVTCDVCGANAWHPPQRRPRAQFGRAQDDMAGNTEYWWLDLCVECKRAVMDVLREIAETNGYKMPKTRQEIYE